MRVKKQTKKIFVAPVDPIVHFGEHALSPFVINLKSCVPTPEEILEHNARINLNLLCEFPNPKPRTSGEAGPGSAWQNPTPSLELNPSELFEQFHEERKTSFPFPLSTFLPFSISPFSSFSSFASFSSISKLNQHISLDDFQPKQPPQDIFEYFDLPEKEIEPEESELVELNGAKIETVAWSLSLRPIGAFVLLSFIFVLPLQAMGVVGKIRNTKTEMENQSKAAFASLTDFNFSKASARFGSAKQTLSELGTGTSFLLSSLPITNKKFKAANSLINAGDQISIAFSRVDESLNALAKNTSQTPVSKIRTLQSYIQSAIPHLEQAEHAIKNVNKKSIPEENQKIFEETKTRLPLLLQSMNEFNKLSDLSTTILGESETKRYLLIFQNNTEIRATGGFMGSFAEVKVRDGIIEQLDVPKGGTYDLQGSILRSYVAPKPLQILKARWEFQDANWFPDFKTSARQIMEFYRNAGGPSVDGVIAINATYVAELVGLLGPIEMPEYNRIMDEENFLFETQKIVELEYDKEENHPKQFIGDLAPKIIEKALESNPETFLTLIDYLQKGLAQKDVQMYFNDETIEKEIIKNNWGGAVLPNENDYLMVVNTNLGGGKTDGVIEEKIEVDVKIQDDGSVINTVTIERKHNGIQGVIFTGVNNVDYMRLYVPKDSDLISASGFSIPDARLFETPEENWETDDDILFASVNSTKDEKSGTDIYEESGKTVFGNWVQTPPGLTSRVQFTYRLPEETIDKSYSLTIQKQPGVLDRKTTVKITLPEQVKTIWQSHDLSQTTFDNKTDEMFSILFEKEL